jgi:hypothetical protein
MATAMFVKTENLQHSMWLIPESQSHTLSSSHKNLKTRVGFCSPDDRNGHQLVNICPVFIKLGMNIMPILIPLHQQD